MSTTELSADLPLCFDDAYEPSVQEIRAARIAALAHELRVAADHLDYKAIAVLSETIDAISLEIQASSHIASSR